MKIILLIFAASVVFFGCRASGPSSLQKHRWEEAQQIQQPSHATQVLGLGPIEWPDYLNRPQFIKVDEDNRLLIHHTHIWEPALSAAFPQSLAQDLQSLESNWKIHFHPWYRRLGVQTQVSISIEAFEARTDGSLVLAGQFRIQSHDGKKDTLSQDFHYQKASQTQNISEQVELMRELVSKLSREIHQKMKLHLNHSSRPSGLPISER